MVQEVPDEENQCVIMSPSSVIIVNDVPLEDDEKQNSTENGIDVTAVDGEEDTNNTSHFDNINNNDDEEDDDTNKNKKCFPESPMSGDTQSVQWQDQNSMVTKDIATDDTPKKWYCRPFYLSMFVLVGCIVIAIVITAVVVSTKPQQGQQQEQVPETPEQIACNFIGQSTLDDCRLTTTYTTDAFMSRGTPIPTEIGLLQQLSELYLWYDGLTGTIPSEIGLLTNLRWLSFWSASSLSGSIPSSIGNLTQLTFLDFSYSGVTGRIPTTIFTSLTHLGELYFSSTQTTGSIPTSLIQLTKLDYLSLDGTSLTGSIPPALCTHTTEILIDCGTIECRCCHDYLYDDDSSVNPSCSS